MSVREGGTPGPGTRPMTGFPDTNVGCSTMKTIEFVVSIGQPAGVTVAQLQAYIADAAGAWCGQFRPPGEYNDADPGDPLWDIGETVAVKRKCKPKP